MDAMVKAWEQQEDKTEQPSMNAVHAVMMAQAAARYKGRGSKSGFFINSFFMVYLLSKRCFRNENDCHRFSN